MVVIGEDAEGGGAEAKGGEGAAEGLGLADAAEGGDGGIRGNVRLFGAISGEKDGASGVIFSDFLDNSRVLSALFRTGDDDGASAGEGGEGFAEAPRGEDAAAERIDGVDEDDIERAGDFPVLEAVVEEEDVRLEFAPPGQKAAGGDAVCADGDGGAAVAEEELGLVAGEFDGEGFAGEGGDGLTGGAAVAAGEDGGAEAAGGELAGEPPDEGSLSGAAHGEVADADDWAIEPLRADEGAVESHAGEPQAGEGVERGRAGEPEVVEG